MKLEELRAKFRAPDRIQISKLEINDKEYGSGSMVPFKGQLLRDYQEEYTQADSKLCKWWGKEELSETCRVPATTWANRSTSNPLMETLKTVYDFEDYCRNTDGSVCLDKKPFPS